MSPKPVFGGGALCTSLAAGLLAALPWGAAAQCADRAVSWRLSAISNLSQWDEFDAAGKRIVHESGTFPGAELAAGLRCGDWQWQAQVAWLQGVRLYDGQTSAGVPVTTQSALRQLQGHLQLGLNVTEAWQLGGRLSNQILWRDIASVPGASGYPERYDWTMLSVGAQWQTALGPGQLALAAWLGTPLVASMVVTLPGRDRATLTLASMRQVELAAAWRMPLRPGWSLEADLRYHRTEMGQSPDVVITRAGVPLGVAHQPRTLMVDVPLALRINYQF